MKMDKLTQWAIFSVIVSKNSYGLENVEFLLCFQELQFIIQNRQINSVSQFFSAIVSKHI